MSTSVNYKTSKLATLENPHMIYWIIFLISRDITPADIEECKQQINPPIDTLFLINVNFQQIDDCVQCTVDRKVVSIAHQILPT